MLLLIICLSFSCTSSKVASLSDYISSEGTKDDEDQGQSFFAGGSEHRYTCTCTICTICTCTCTYCTCTYCTCTYCTCTYCTCIFIYCFSGQMISGPPRKKKDLAKEVFEGAKK